MITKPDICVFHNPCQDGFTSAWAVWLRWPDTKFHPAAHGNSPPDVTGLHVLICDFSYPRHHLDHMLATAASVTILDHHKTAKASLTPLLEEGTLQGEFDMERSGAMMTWQAVWPADEENQFDKREIGDYDPDTDTWVKVGTTGHIPLLVRFVQDRDLWVWLLKDTRAVLAYAATIEQTFENWTALAHELENEKRYAEIAEMGGLLVDRQDRDLESCINATKRRMIIGGFDVPVANLPHIMASDAGNIMCKGEAFAASYFENNKGVRIFSLRSDNTDPNAMDVSEIAKLYQGGGHHHASGFKMPNGWEGDRPLNSFNDTNPIVVDFPVKTLEIKGRPVLTEGTHL